MSDFEDMCRLETAKRFFWPISNFEDLHELLAWWRLRKSVRMTLNIRQRITYYVAPHWIESIRQEATMTGDTQGDVLERALVLYFTGKGDAS